MKANIVGTEVDCYSFDEVVELTIQQALMGTAPKYIVTPNAQHINNLQSDSLFRKIYSQAFLVVPDGVSIVWAAKFLKNPLKGKISGINLFEKLCERGASTPLKIFLLGGRPQAAEKAAAILEQRYPGLKIAGTYCIIQILTNYAFAYPSMPAIHRYVFFDSFYNIGVIVTC